MSTAEAPVIEVLHWVWLMEVYTRVTNLPSLPRLVVPVGFLHRREDSFGDADDINVILRGKIFKF